MTKERLQKAEKMIDFVQNDQKIAASEYKELQKMNNNHESSNKDCLLILEQSERITELESAMQLIINEIEGHETRHIDICIKAKTTFKQLLSKKG